MLFRFVFSQTLAFNYTATFFLEYKIIFIAVSRGLKFSLQQWLEYIFRALNARRANESRTALEKVEHCAIIYRILVEENKYLRIKSKSKSVYCSFLNNSVPYTPPRERVQQTKKLNTLQTEYSRLKYENDSTTRLILLIFHTQNKY